tara:strand:- start:1382 stop:1912 length:531 start_codon:yes stop_codon:yes gene_type:complete
MPTKMTSQIFATADAISDINDRVEYLRNNASQAVKELINVNFNPEIKMLLPEGRPNFLEGDDKPPTYDDASLNYEVRRLYLFVEGGSPNLTDLKRETLWIEMLNSLHGDEADDLTHMKDRTLHKKYKNITHEVCHLAFPEFVRQPKPKPVRNAQGRFSAKENEETPKKKTKRKKKT